MTTDTLPRTDCHRPGAIIPQDYSDLFWIDCGSGEELPHGINCLRPLFNPFTGKIVEGAKEHSADGMCCVQGLWEAGYKKAHTDREHGPGKCTVCGSYFRYGVAWQHIPTGEVVFLGHDCADKYDMVARNMDKGEWEAYRSALEHKRAEAARLMLRAEARDRFIHHHNLEDVFAVRDQNSILQDLYSRLHQWGSLTDRQIEFAKKLAYEVKHPVIKEEEKHVDAPTGRVTFEGVIVGTKWQESQYGDTPKITVKVTTPDGIWLAWGTLPSQADGDLRDQRGRTIKLSATLSHGNDPHFAFFKRPTLIDISPIKE